MKIIRKTDGKVIEVVPQRFMECDGSMYAPSDLDFSVGEAKEAEGEVLSGWAARDSDGSLRLFEVKPERVRYRRSDEGLWMAKTMTDLGPNIFPNLTWDSEPQKVEITIKPKKKSI